MNSSLTDVVLRHNRLGQVLTAHSPKPMTHYVDLAAMWAVLSQQKCCCGYTELLALPQAPRTLDFATHVGDGVGNGRDAAPQH